MTKLENTIWNWTVVVVSVSVIVVYEARPRPGLAPPNAPARAASAAPREPPRDEEGQTTWITRSVLGSSSEQIAPPDETPDRAPEP